MGVKLRLAQGHHTLAYGDQSFTADDDGIVEVPNELVQALIERGDIELAEASAPHPSDPLAPSDNQKVGEEPFIRTITPKDPYDGPDTVRDPRYDAVKVSDTEAVKVTGVDAIKVVEPTRRVADAPRADSIDGDTFNNTEVVIDNEQAGNQTSLEDGTKTVTPTTNNPNPDAPRAAPEAAEPARAVPLPADLAAKAASKPADKDAARDEDQRAADKAASSQQRTSNAADVKPATTDAKKNVIDGGEQRVVEKPASDKSDTKS